MNEQDKQAQENIEALKLRATFLICQLAKKPYAASLLTKACKFLEGCLGYKSDRAAKARSRQPQKTSPNHQTARGGIFVDRTGCLIANL